MRMGWLSRVRLRFKRRKPSLQERFPQYEIGRASYGNPAIRDWGEGASLKIGAFCSMAAGVKIFLGGEHRTDWVTTFPFPVLWKKQAGHIPGHPKTRGDVIIGNDVWIGTEAIILSGVHIGDGAVIGARAVVASDVPPYAIVAGNPARLVRLRFADNLIERLQKVAWWNWDDERIARHMHLLLSEDIGAFIDAVAAEEATPAAGARHG
jgi:acetyltransferase-like isoleucine patch superfamily enzyme